MPVKLISVKLVSSFSFHFLFRFFCLAFYLIIRVECVFFVFFLCVCECFSVCDYKIFAQEEEGDEVFAS